MQIDSFLWILLPVFVAGGSALLSFYIMQARMEIALAKAKEHLVEARAEVRIQKVTMEERVKAVAEETRCKAEHEFMQEFRVEERHYFRENHAAHGNTRSMVMQERLVFRNLPLSNWVTQEMLIEESHSEDIQQLAKGASIFSTRNIPEQQPGTPHLLDSTLPIALERAS